MSVHFTLNQLPMSHWKLGLERIQAFLETVGNPQDQIPTVHVAGTNGKGSTIAMLASVLTSAGYTVGSTVSPHLCEPRERIRINTVPITEELFEEVIAEILTRRQHVAPDDRLTYFETLIAAAFWMFARQKVDIALIEVGLGGRLDATNVLKKPLVTVLTGVDYDHMEHLGDTLIQIATEKTGIFKFGVPVVLGPDLPEEAYRVVIQKASDLNCPVQASPAAPWQPVHSHLASGTQTIFNPQRGQRYELGLLGPYQTRNMSTVLTVIETLRSQGWMMSEKAVADGLRQARWPGRMQWLPQERLLIDGSHNPQGFKALAEALRSLFAGKTVHWMLSMRSNRDPLELFRLIKNWPPTGSVVWTTAGEGHAAGGYHAPDTLMADAKEYGLTQPMQAVKEPKNGLELLRKTIKPDNNAVGITTGSLYTAGAVLNALNATV